MCLIKTDNWEITGNREAVIGLFNTAGGVDERKI